MWLKRLEADRLRNLKAVGIDLPAGMTLIAGRNGQGKTSLLEAAYALGTGRSFRTRHVEELLAWNGGPLRVAGEVRSRRGDSRLAVIVDAGTRALVVDGVSRSLEQFIGRLDVVDLTAERMNVLRGGPEERRRFLDRGVLGLDGSYLRALGEYRRVLQQRNALLRRQPGGNEARLRAELGAWDERLVRAGAEIHRRRRQYAVLLANALGEVTRALLGAGEEIGLHYKPSPSAAENEEPERFPEVFAEVLGRMHKRDLGLRHTGCGPHRDELSVELSGVDLRTFGSAGQVRASMVALKLGKLSLLRKDREESPLFLLDDFDSDIDEARAAALARFLEAGGFQALVATSKEKMAERLGVSFATIRMADGTIVSG